MEMKNIMTDSPRFHLIAVLMIVLAGGVIYAGTLNNPFVFDDAPNILENSSIRVTELDFPSLRAAVSEGTNITRPLGCLSFALNYYFGGYDPAGYHLVNIVIHLINGVLVYFIALMVFGRLLPGAVSVASTTGENPSGAALASVPGLALFAALVFTLHPLQTQAVAYVVQRYTSMAAMFYMGSLLLFIKARALMAAPGPDGSSPEPKTRRKRAGGKPVKSGARGKKGGPKGKKARGRGKRTEIEPERKAPGNGPRITAWGLFAASISCGAMAVLSKQNAVSLPGAILFVEWLMFDRTWKGWKRKLMWLTPLFAALLAGALYISGVLTGEVGFGAFLEDVSEMTRQSETIGRWTYLCTQFNVLVIYLRMLVFPMGQNVDPMYALKTGFFDGFTPLAFVLLVALAAAAVRSVRKRPILTFSIAWFFITLSVESSVIPITDPMFEHRLYLPMLGFALLLGHLPVYAPARHRSSALALACVVLLCLGVSTHMRNRVWRSKLTLWADAAEKNPDNHRAQSNLGIALVKAGKHTEGVERLRAAVAAKPDFAQGRFNLGRALEDRGDLDGAAEAYSEAVRLNKRYVKAYMNLGVIRGRQGRYEEASTHFEYVLKERRRSAAAHVNLGMALSRLGREKEAVAHFRTALEIEPDSGSTHYYLGLALARQGDVETAAKHFNETLHLIPNHAGATRALGAGLARRAGPAAAPVTRTGPGDELARRLEAVRADPNSADAHYNLAVVLADRGRRSEAVRQYSEAIRIDPGHAEAHGNLGVLLARANRLDEALIHFHQAILLKPDSPGVLTSMGGVQYLKGNFKEAVEKYTAALRVDPNFKPARDNLARLLQEMRAKGPAKGPVIGD